MSPAWLHFAQNCESDDIYLGIPDYFVRGPGHKLRLLLRQLLDFHASWVTLTHP